MSQTGGQRYSDTSPFSIPWYNVSILGFLDRQAGNSANGVGTTAVRSNVGRRCFFISESLEIDN